MTRRRPPRLGLSLYVGVQRYFLTICCEDRERRLSDSGTRALILRELARTSGVHGFAVVAYCLMPDHLHAVVEGLRDDSDFFSFVRAFKQQTAYAYKRRVGGRLWQSSFHDHALRGNESTQAVVRYVLENPVRARLAKSPCEYPYSGSLVYSKEEVVAWAFGSRSDLM